MRAYARGETSALETLFERYAPRVRAFLRRDIRDDGIADDLLQETFLLLHRARRDFRADGSLVGWLFTIARNLKIGHFRQKGRRPDPAPLLSDVPAADPVAGAQQHRSLREALDAALAALPANQREVVRMHWMDQVPYAEIARRLGASESAVKVRAHRAYQTLKRVLDSADTGLGVKS